MGNNSDLLRLSNILHKYIVSKLKHNALVVDLNLVSITVKKTSGCIFEHFSVVFYVSYAGTPQNHSRFVIHLIFSTFKKMLNSHFVDLISS